MTKPFRSLSFVVSGILLIKGAVAYAGTDYVLLVQDLPFIGNATDLGGYLSNLFKLGLGVAVTLAVVMIVMNGIQYMFSDIPGVKIGAKNNLGDIIWGLVLAFGAWLILATINPNILKFDFITSLNEAATMAGDNTETQQPTPSTCSTTCVPLPSILPKRTSCGGQECKLDQGIIAQLTQLNTALGSAHIGWVITEAWPNTGNHNDPCHASGTCIDANFKNPNDASRDNILAFLYASLAVGLNPIYEVCSQEELNVLTNADIPTNLTGLNTSSRCTAPHFHIK